MIVSESDALSAALDRRLAVDPVLALDPVAPLGSTANGGRPAAASSASDAPDVARQLPLGSRVDARVVDASEPGHVRVEIGNLQLTLAWPSASTPAVGQRIPLRVLAQSPMLLFEQIALEDPAAATDVPTTLSAAARALQSARASTADPAGAGVRRFTAPILRLEVDGPAAAAVAAAPVGAADHIPLDQVLVARGPVVERPVDLATLAPLVLQGPAWPGQDMELVVHREREDESFDNAALDQWCGELVIDLPMLGRVSGHLAWSMHGLRVRLEGADATSVALMNATAPEFARALADVGLPVLALSVGQPVVDGPRGAFP